ncbi:MAG TPA: hypothetical protein DIS62_06425 [Candidatus Kerfeldbacteria bacterium]|nr:hypothetical protein [Candidatus Kerfeldbacteria bacterium]
MVTAGWIYQSVHYWYEDNGRVNPWEVDDDTPPNMDEGGAVGQRLFPSPLSIARNPSTDPYYEYFQVTTLSDDVIDHGVPIAIFEDARVGKAAVTLSDRVTMYLYYHPSSIWVEDDTAADGYRSLFASHDIGYDILNGIEGKFGLVMRLKGEKGEFTIGVMGFDMKVDADGQRYMLVKHMPQGMNSGHINYSSDVRKVLQEVNFRTSMMQALQNVATSYGLTRIKILGSLHHPKGTYSNDQAEQSRIYDIIDGVAVENGYTRDVDGNYWLEITKEESRKDAAPFVSNFTGCLVDDFLIHRVYAATTGTSGTTCPWFLRAPWKVIAVSGVGATMLSDSTGRVWTLIMAELAKYMSFIASRYNPPIPPYKNLPNAPPVGFMCQNGACSNGCGHNLTCGEDGQCCEYKKEDMAACSLRGHIYVKGYDGLFKPEIYPGGNPVDKITTMVDQYDKITSYVPAQLENKYTPLGVPDISTCIGGCNDQSGCTQLATSCPKVGLIDMIGRKGFKCQADGTWKLLTIEESQKIAQDLFSCSSDGRLIVDKETQAVFSVCGDNDTCMNSSPPYCQPTSYVYGCSTNQIIEGGMRCTSKGLQCSPNTPFALTKEYSCQRQCNANGDGYDYPDWEHFTCAPDSEKYIDRTCYGNQVYEVRSNRGSSHDPRYDAKIVEECPVGCSSGICQATPYTFCSEGQIAMGVGSDCAMICRNGRFASAPWCNKVDVVGYNNQSTYHAYAEMSSLPSHFFDEIDRTPLIMSWSTEVGGPGGAGIHFGREQTGLPYDFIKISTSSDDANYIIHELIHAWAVHQGRQSLSKEQYDKQYNYYLSVGYSEDMARQLPYHMSNDYIKTVGGSIESYGQFHYKPEYNPCKKGSTELCWMPPYEDIAYKGSEYVTNACELKNNAPEKYAFFRDHMFGGREYLPPEGCGN